MPSGSVERYNAGVQIRYVSHPSHQRDYIYSYTLLCQSRLLRPTLYTVYVESCNNGLISVSGGSHSMSS